jgi:hypothetical protein
LVWAAVRDFRAAKSVRAFLQWELPAEPAGR